jgi:small subunit ribosomal protein S9
MTDIATPVPSETTAPPPAPAPALPPSFPIWTTGRRKTAVARVRLTAGSGKITVNGRPFDSYFHVEAQRTTALRPLALTDSTAKYDVLVNLCGGGPNGQADALRLGLARALLQVDINLKNTLRSEGLLTRDPRMRERKKYGQPGARKRYQFSKR